MGSSSALRWLNLLALCLFAGALRAPPAPQEITLGVVTWNLAAKTPSRGDCAWLAELKNCSIVVIGAQETEELSAVVVGKETGERRLKWRRAIRKAFPKSEFVLLPPCASGGLDMCVFARKSIVKSIVACEMADVACGVGNVLKNKGAIGAFIELARPKGRNNLRLLLVVAHLAAHAPKVAERNADYWRICRELDEARPDGWHREDPSSSSRAGLLEACDFVVFAGDLNYRLDLSREEAELALAEVPGDAFQTLGLYDQLTRERGARRAFAGFAEGRIRFPPTFKLEKQQDCYDASKKRRVPAWTDRILYTPRPPTARRNDEQPAQLSLSKYASVPKARHSDHRPVFATFKVNHH